MEDENGEARLRKEERSRLREFSFRPAANSIRSGTPLSASCCFPRSRILTSFLWEIGFSKKALTRKCQLLSNGLPPLAKLPRVLIDMALVSGLDPDFGDPFWQTIRARIVCQNARVVSRGQLLVDQLASRNYCHLLYKTA